MTYVALQEWRLISNSSAVQAGHIHHVWDTVSLSAKVLLTSFYRI